MDRRNFLGTLIGGIAAEAAVRSFPFRVYSFPSEIKIPTARFVAWPIDTKLKFNRLYYGYVHAESPREIKWIDAGEIRDGSITYFPSEEFKKRELYR